MEAQFFFFKYIYYILEIGVNEVIKIILKQSSCAVNFHTGKILLSFQLEIYECGADQFELGFYHSWNQRRIQKWGYGGSAPHYGSMKFMVSSFFWLQSLLTPPPS